jgi:hypothetical protein
MNKSILYGSKFYIITKSLCELLEKTFSGNPILRTLISDEDNKCFAKKDNLLKSSIKCNNQTYVMQWQLGTYWDKSVMPTLTKKFGIGQLKYYTDKNAYNNVIFQNKVSQL